MSSTITGNVGGAAASGAQVQCLNTLDSKAIVFSVADSFWKFTRFRSLVAGVYQISAFLSGFVYYHPVLVTADGTSTFPGINLSPTALSANNAPTQASNF